MTEQTKGIYSVSDLLSNRFGANFASYDLSGITSTINEAVSSFNSQRAGAVGDLCAITTKARRPFDVMRIVEMQLLPEDGMPDNRKNPKPDEVAFPLLTTLKEDFSFTWKWMQLASPSDLILAMQQAVLDYNYTVLQYMKRAIFIRANYTDTDPVDGTTLYVKKFLNAEAAMSKVPVDPNGSPLVNSADPGVHTHFLYRASTLANSDVTGAIVHITEHGISKGIRIYTALASAAGLTALSDFVPASRIGIRESSEDAIATQAISGDLNPADSFLGLWLGLYPVFTKAWMPANYYLIFAGNELEKPLAMREREQSSLRGLVTVPADMAQYPLGFRTFESEFGFGAFSRAMASVLYIGNTSWSDATI